MRIFSSAQHATTRTSSVKLRTHSRSGFKFFNVLSAALLLYLSFVSPATALTDEELLVVRDAFDTRRDATRWAAAHMITSSPHGKDYRYEDGSTAAEQLTAWRVFLRGTTGMDLCTCGTRVCSSKDCSGKFPLGRQSMATLPR